MDAKKILELTAATEVLDSDTFVVEQSGKARKVTAAILKALFGGGEADSAKNGLPAGGAAGQMLVKKSEEDYDAEWQDAPEGGSGSRAAKVDYTNWDDGSFTVTMADGTSKSGTVDFDDNGNAKSITLDGHTLDVTFPA